MTKTRNQQGSKIFTELTKFEFLFQNRDLINGLLKSCANGSLSSSQVGQAIYCMKLAYQDQSSLPSWMTSNQPSSATGKFNPPLGFTKAVVMAYTVPGAGKLIAYRLKNSGINFNNIKFTV